MWTFVKTALVTTVLALIIWIFAESESLRTAEVRSVEVSVLPVPGSQYTVDVGEAPFVRGNVVRADINLDGPAAALDVVERLLRRPIIISPGMPGFSSDPGHHTVDLLTVLQSHPDLRLASRGVAIRNVNPETIDITVDQLVTRQVKVELDTPGADLDGPPELKTTTVALTIPQSQASKLDDNSTVIARIEPAALTRLSPGRKETITGIVLKPPTSLAGIARVKIDPPTLEVSLTIRSKTAMAKVTSVPVHIRIAPSELNKWDIEIPEQDRFLTDVTITGPSDLIKQVQDKTVPLVATVPLSFEELERAIPTKDAIFCDLPTGLRFDVANKAGRLKIKKREPSTVPPAGSK